MTIETVDLTSPESAEQLRQAMLHLADQLHWVARSTGKTQAILTLPREQAIPVYALIERFFQQPKQEAIKTNGNS